MTENNHNFMQVFAARLQAVRRDRRAVVPPPAPPGGPTEPPNYYTLREAAAIARVCPRTIRRWGVPLIKPRGRILVKRVDLEKFLEQNKVGGDDAAL
jgi:hypothetical protein